MNTIKMPGFVADASLYKTRVHYQSVVANQSYASEGLWVVAQIRAGGGFGAVRSFERAAESWKCDRGGCRCDGASDCLDMVLGTDVCGGNLDCYIGWVTGELVCTCTR